MNVTLRDVTRELGRSAVDLRTADRGAVVPTVTVKLVWMKSPSGSVALTVSVAEPFAPAGVSISVEPLIDVEVKSAAFVFPVTENVSPARPSSASAKPVDRLMFVGGASGIVVFGKPLVVGGRLAW